MTKEAFDAHYNWVLAVIDWAKSKSPQWIEENKFLDHESVDALIAELPQNVRDAGEITFEYSEYCHGAIVRGHLNASVAYLRYAPHVMGCVAFNVTFSVYQRKHSRAEERLIRLFKMDGPIMRANLERFYPWHLEKTEALPSPLT